MKSYTATYKTSNQILEYIFEAENIQEAKYEANRYKHEHEIHARMKVRRTKK
jgi:hypothetical protein